MSLKPDIAIYSPDGRLQVIVEVKAVVDTDQEWAAQYRRNFLAHEVIPVAPYFLLLTADRAYLWSGNAVSNKELPKAQIAINVLLKRFLPKNGSRLIETSLEMATLAWLRDLASASPSALFTGDTKSFLEGSGLLDKIRTGSLALEPSL